MLSFSCICGNNKSLHKRLIGGSPASPPLPSPSLGHRSCEAQMSVYKTLTDICWLQCVSTAANKPASNKLINNRF